MLVKHISRVFQLVDEDLVKDLRNRRSAHLLVNRGYRKFTHSQQPIRRVLKG